MSPPEPPDAGKQLPIVFKGKGGEVLTGEVIDADEAILPASSYPTAHVPPIAIGQMLQSVPDVLQAVHGGKIMRVIGDQQAHCGRSREGYSPPFGRRKGSLVIFDSKGRQKTSAWLPLRPPPFKSRVQ